MQTTIDRDAVAAFENAGLPDPETTRSMPPPQAAGRGAVTNPGVRFELQTAFPFDDGWETLTQDIGDLPRLDTSLIRDFSRSARSVGTSHRISASTAR